MEMNVLKTLEKYDFQDGGQELQIIVAFVEPFHAYTLKLFKFYKFSYIAYDSVGNETLQRLWKNIISKMAAKYSRLW